MTKRVALVTGIVLVSACSDGTAPRPFSQQVGILQLRVPAETTPPPDSSVHWDVPPGDDTITPARTIEVPDTVRVGAPFTVTVHTFGLDACWEADGQDETVGSHVIEITPYDRHPDEGACGEMVRLLAHESAITVHEAGTWTVRARGRRVRAHDPGAATPVVAERTIIAQ
ncbi:MAG TPA: hypothetical protein VFZ69_03100 [Longimicrobiales bacterium]